MKWIKLLFKSVKPSYTPGKSKLLLILETDNSKMDEVNKLLSSSFELILQKKRKKRSLSANGYAWVLCDKIAQKINSSKEEVYRRAIHRVGVFDTLSINSKAVQRLKEGWEKNGIGWFIDILSDDGISADVCMYYGSSSYSSAEMARLIDWLVEEAEELEIDILPPSQRALLLDDRESNGDTKRKEN